MTTLTANGVVVTGGVDTHQDLHVAAALDQLGRVLGTESFPTTVAGYRRLLALAAQASVSSTRSASRAPAATAPRWPGSWPTPASRCIEVARPNRQVRRRYGKTDVVDAIAAARAVQSGEATGTAQEPRRSGRGAADAESRTAQRKQGPHPSAESDPPAARHRSGRAARTAATAQRKELLATCAAFRIGPDDDSLQAMTRLALRELAQRVLHPRRAARAGRPTGCTASPATSHPSSSPSRASARTPPRRC